MEKLKAKKDIMTDRPRFKDHFSGYARSYARSRPHYPKALFQWLASVTPGRSLAWDAATGNGQAACALARTFEKVVATDASRQQLEHARKHDRVEYRVETAERSSLANGTVNLVTVGQALHWFQLEDFYRECRRTLRPGGLLAAWTYTLARVSPDVDAIIDRLYGDILEPYWPPERRFVEQEYTNLPFPFKEIEAPPFVLQTRWTLADYLAYIRTWSAVQRYQAQHHSDPLTHISNILSEAWGESGRVRDIRWPLALRAGYSK